MNTNRTSRFIPALLTATALCQPSQAATLNEDAGSLLKQNEQPAIAVKPAKKAAPQKQKPSFKESADDSAVLVRAFKFSGNFLLSNEVLNAAVADYANHALTLAQLKEVADVVMSNYRDAGWMVRAYLPKQEIEDGVITIQVVEAVFGAASLTGPEPQRIEVIRLINMAEAIMGKGTPLQTAKLDRTLLILDDTPGVSVAGNLVPGERDGETNLVITATDKVLLTGNASYDNQGSRATGTDRLSVNLSINSPARAGDALAIQALGTQGSEYSRLSYTLPLENQGWRVGANTSHLEYRILESYQSKSGTRGKADTAGVEANYPLVRSQLVNINTNLSFTNKWFENTKGDVLDSNYSMAVSTYSLSGQQLDNWLGGGMSSASTQLTVGKVERADSVDYSRDQAATGQQTAGMYRKFNLSFSRLQTITPEWSLYAAVSHQHASKNLDTSEKLYISGATGVRAYPGSEPGGSEGNTFTLELRQRVNNQWTVTGFYDYAWLRANVFNNSAETPNEYALQGYGLSATWQPRPGMELKATAAQRVGSNPKAKTDGTDGDGTKKFTRYWLSAGIAF